MKMYMAEVGTLLPEDLAVEEWPSEWKLISPRVDDVSIDYVWKWKVNMAIAYDTTCTPAVEAAIHEWIATGYPTVNIMESKEVPPGVIQLLADGEIWEEWLIEDILPNQAEIFQSWVKNYHRYPRTSEVALLKKLGVNGFGFKKGSGNYKYSWFEFDDGSEYIVNP